MKLFSMLATVLFFSQSTFATNSLTKNDQTLNLTNIDYQLVDMNLDANRFQANNMLLSLTNVSDKGLQLNIMNNICPHVPGKVSCMAMPYPLFTSEFKLGQKKVDNCGVVTQKSAFVNVKSINNPNKPVERAQLIIRDYRFMTCEIKYFADLEIELNLKSSTGKSQSKIWLNKVEITKMPIIVEPMPGLPVMPVEHFYAHNATEVSGPFFQEATGLRAEVSLDENSNQISLNVMADACPGLPCEGFSHLIGRDLAITSVKSNKCGELTYFTESVSVYDAYPAVVGAVHTYVTVELHDSRNSLCGNQEGSVSARVIVQEKRDFGMGLLIENESEATFELRSIK